MTRRLSAILVALIVFAYLLAGVVYIDSASALDLRGVKRWVLFDDAMISFRYASNFVDGEGLVWNPGEYVEGYTNPLWTLFMAAAIYSVGLQFAPLLIQLVCVGLVAISGLLVWMTARLIAERVGGNIGVASFASILCFFGYWPVTFWAIGGMEVSLLLLLTSFATYVVIRHGADNAFAVGVSLVILATIAYFVRPDGFICLIPIGALHVFRAWQAGDLREIGRNWWVVMICGAIAIVHMIWRHEYYGAYFPNTYTLKVVGHSLAWRLENGIVFVSPFLQSLIASAALILLSFYISRRHIRYLVFLVAPLVILVIYQVYVGGDPWPYWRQVVPGIAGWAVALGVSFSILVESKTLLNHRLLKTVVVFVLICVVVVSVNRSFRYEIFLREKPYTFAENEAHVRFGQALREVMPEGKAMVVSAGVISSYFGGYSIDALGKTDTRIANLAPQRDVIWLGMNGVPGHNKYDLKYSIVEKKADYVQIWKWGGDSLESYIRNNFVLIE